MASKVQICNIALSRLGANRITSLTDNTEEARICNVLYNDIAEEVMAEGSWSSTINRAALNVTTNTPSYGYTKEYQLPTNPPFLRILEINDTKPGETDYRIEGDKLLCDVSGIKIKYIGNITDTQSYDVFLKRAITSRLTAELAYTLTGQRNIGDFWYARYERDVQVGLALDGQQGSNQITISDDLLDVR